MPLLPFDFTPYYVCVCVGGHTCATVLMWRSEDSFVKLVLSFHSQRLQEPNARGQPWATSAVSCWTISSTSCSPLKAVSLLHFRSHLARKPEGRRPAQGDLKPWLGRALWNMWHLFTCINLKIVLQGVYLLFLCSFLCLNMLLLLRHCWISRVVH